MHLVVLGEAGVDGLAEGGRGRPRHERLQHVGGGIPPVCGAMLACLCNTNMVEESSQRQAPACCRWLDANEFFQPGCLATACSLRPHEEQHTSHA